jgi:cellulose synthase (UDP-forming)
MNNQNSSHAQAAPGIKLLLLLGALVAVSLYIRESFQIEAEVIWQYAGEFIKWSRGCLLLPAENAPISWIIYPSLITLGLATVLRLLFDRPPDWIRLPVAIGFLVLQVTYLWFRLVFTLSFENLGDEIVSILFFLSELFIHFRIALGNLSLLSLTDRTAEADSSQDEVRSEEFVPSVDVFVPTYSEPVEMLRRTIIGCQAITYPQKRIYLLDDQRRSAMRVLAEELGCEYLDRPDNSHAKAGNLNHAIPLSQGEFIACFDADFVPCSNFLERTVGFFRDESVAMVQTPQNFFNEDAITKNLGLEHALEDEQRLFFRTLQPGRDSMNAVVCHGSCFIARRSALEEIGGVPTETITEDWATSIKLQAAGYRILYLNEPLSAGMSADKCGEFVQQRARWAQGTLQAMFASTNPLKVNGLNWKQRVLHFSSIIYYLGSLSTLFNLIAPVLFLFFGTHLLRMTLPEMVLYRFPFAIGFYLLYAWLTRGTRSPLWTELYEAFLAPSMGLTVLRTLFKPFGAGFRVTDKSIRQGTLCLNRRVAFPFVVLILLHLAGFGFALLTQRHMEEPEAFSIATYFVITNLATLWLCFLVSIDVAQEHPYPRFAVKTPCLVTFDDTGVSGETEFLSEGDLVMRMENPKKFQSSNPEAAFVHIPKLGLHDVPVRCRSVTGDERMVFDFVDLTLKQRRRLIEFLFCKPNQWDRGARNELVAAWEFLRAGLRMFPLAESK